MNDAPFRTETEGRASQPWLSAAVVRCAQLLCADFFGDTAGEQSRAKLRTKVPRRVGPVAVCTQRMPVAGCTRKKSSPLCPHECECL
jgi:hypothetical protein